MAAIRRKEERSLAWRLQTTLNLLTEDTVVRIWHYENGPCVVDSFQFEWALYSKVETLPAAGLSFKMPFKLFVQNAADETEYTYMAIPDEMCLYAGIVGVDSMRRSFHPSRRLNKGDKIYAMHASTLPTSWGVFVSCSFFVGT